MKENLIDLHKKEKKVGAKKIIIPVLLGVIIFFALIVGATYGYAYNYKDKIYPGIKIAGYDVGGLNCEEAQKVVKNKISKLEAVGIDLNLASEKDNLLYSEAGIGFDNQDSVKNAFAYARNDVNIWEKTKKMFSALFRGKNIDLVTKIDDEILHNKILGFYKDKLSEVQDASFKIREGKVVIVNEQYGKDIDIDNLKKSIVKLVNSENISQTITVKTVDAKPNIQNNDIIILIPQLEKLISKKIVYQDGYYYYSPTQEDIASFIYIKKIDDQSAIATNEEGIKKYVDFLASKIDTLAIDKKVEENTGKVIQEGNDGRILNKEKTIEDTKKAVSDGNEKTNIALDIETTLKKEQKIKQKTSGGNAGLYSGKYIEVNLSTQTMYAYEGENQIASYAVSTGAWNYPTPIGTRYILDKSLKPFSQQYGLYMPFWNGLGGGYGIHELPEWPGGYKEGESHLGTPVSHGCIRLGVGAAEMIYYWAPIGTPVYIHY